MGGYRQCAYSGVMRSAVQCTDASERLLKHWTALVFVLDSQCYLNGRCCEEDCAYIYENTRNKLALTGLTNYGVQRADDR